MALEGIFALMARLPFYHQIASIIPENFLRISIFTFALFIFGIIMWKFYSTLAKRDLFKINLSPYMSKWEKAGEALAFFFKYTFIFPFYTFFWFLIFSFFLIFLSESLTIEEIFFVSISIISFTRIAAYYKEELAKDVATIIPTTFLLIFLTNPAFFTVDLLLARWESMLSSFPEVLIYLLFTICLEWILRVFYLIKSSSSSNQGKRLEEELS
ncbi:MAG: hypothetical protein QXU74_01480 [Candidatus Aenigmatarchaeota archaeon]